MMAKLKHKNIVRLYGAREMKVKDRTEIWMAMEYLEGGNSFDVISGTPGKLSEPYIWRLLLDVAR